MRRLKCEKCGSEWYTASDEDGKHGRCGGKLVEVDMKTGKEKTPPKKA